MSVISIATSLYTIKKVSSTIGWLCCLLIHTYRDLAALLVSCLFPAIRYAPRHGGNSQYCPCVCMPSQWWLVGFSLLLKDGFYRITLKYTSVTVLSCSVVCFSKERIPYKTCTLMEHILLYSQVTLEYTDLARLRIMYILDFSCCVVSQKSKRFCLQTWCLVI